MSIKQMEMVFNDETLNPTRKLIMLVLADSANDGGVCFPSLRTIQKKTGLSRQTISDNLKWLSDNPKYLFKKHRSRKKGGRSSNKYLLYPLHNFSLLDEEDAFIFEDLFSKIESKINSQSQTTGPPPKVRQLDHPPLIQSQTTGPESEPSLININRQSKSYPANLNMEAFKLWCEYKGKRYTSRGKMLSANKLAKYDKDTQMKMVENSIMNNYAGLFEISDKKEKTDGTAWYDSPEYE